MYLSRGIADTKGKHFPMVGLLPSEIRMTNRLQHFGYKRLRVRRKSILALPKEEARGHEFHHSVAIGIPKESNAAYEAISPSGGGMRLEGYAKGNLVSSYVHVHFLSQPLWAKRFVKAAWAWKRKRL